MAPNEFVEHLRQKPPGENPLPKRIPAGNDFTEDGWNKRLDFLAEQNITINTLLETALKTPPEELRGNIENFIGFCQVPVGVIGPIRVNGVYANGDFFVPLATTEGALVASYHRGAHVISQSGGVSAMCLTESVSRAPCFIFSDLAKAGLFLKWLYEQADTFPEIISRKTSFGKLTDIKTAVTGRNVYLIFEYTTGDAAGQNMVTVATEEVCNHIIENSPIAPLIWYLEGNLSGDKKASMLSFLGARGKKVLADIIIPEKIVRNFLHTTPGQMSHYCKTSTLGGVQSGGIGVQGHFANALAALFIACGQDAACVSEASIGITEMETTEDGNLHVSVSLPNLIVGTVGGGTHLPTARECLEIMDCFGKDRARKFAEICAAVAMAGEISIIAALCAGHFGKAHATYRHKV
ncbi:MAG: hydroxymethylglutaryl-CoA reductase [Proteobacteria bacterium]|nr:hydroxymethylglutaryl-CoA reductase [Pseudomonadota bacterium]MBU1736702.1 hydroxymethylglutaryl-CoA reductase [Pseudomonadota bacterium]